MREIEFLPDWYPVMRRRRALAATQSYATAALMTGLLLWGVVGHQQVSQRQALAGQTAQELQQVRGDLKMLDEQLRLKQQLEQQEAVLRKLGLQVDATRLIGELDALMGQQAFVTELSLETEETIRPATVSTVVPPARSGAAPAQQRDQVERKLKVRLVGVAPSDVEVANFLAGISSRSYFDNVAMTYTRDRAGDGRVMREFEVTFLINLTPRGSD